MWSAERGTAPMTTNWELLQACHIATPSPFALLPVYALSSPARGAAA